MTQVKDKPTQIDTTTLKEISPYTLRLALYEEFPKLSYNDRVDVIPLWTPGDNDPDFDGEKKTRYRVNGWTHNGKEMLITFSCFVIAWQGEKGVQYQVVSRDGK